MSHEDSTPFSLQNPSTPEKTRSKTEFIDLSGQTFGRWKVIERSGVLDNRGFRMRWVCRCTCGEIKHIAGGSLRGGKSKSCNACKYYPEYRLIKPGDVFGSHTVIEEIVTPKKIKAFILRCDCGTKTRLTYHQITNRDFRGCHYCPWRLKGSHWRVLFKRMKSHAAKRNLEFNVTLEFILDLLEKQGNRCKLSGVPIGISAKCGVGENTASLDRIDSTLGYLPGNVQWVHKYVNKMKQNFKDEVFIAVCRNVAAQDAKVRRDAKMMKDASPLLF